MKERLLFLTLILGISVVANQRESTVPINSELAVDLQKWVADKKPTDRAFFMPSSILTVMDRDLGCENRKETFGTHLD